MLKTLTKKNYLGVGYIHVFKNDVTGEFINVPCTESEYVRLGELNGSKYNPVMPGCTWVSSLGGTVMVDNPDTLLKENEYCDYDGGYLAIFKRNTIDQAGPVKLARSEVVSDVVDVSKLIWQSQ